MYSSLKKVTENLPKSVEDLRNLATDLIEVVRRLEAENAEKDTIIAEKDALIQELKEKLANKSVRKPKQCCHAETQELNVDVDDIENPCDEFGEEATRPP